MTMGKDCTIELWGRQIWRAMQTFSLRQTKCIL